MREDSTLPNAMKLAKQYADPSMKEEKEKLVNLGRLIIEAIKNGIVCEDGRTRKFDIVDFYFATEFSTDELLYIIRDQLTVNDIRVYRRFQQFNDKKENLLLDHLYESRLFYGVKFDESNKIIEGSGREITLEEKQNIVNFIVNNNLPLYVNVYDALFDRWKKDFLDMPTKFNLDDSSLKR